jgi:hypothetical protein
MSPTFVRVLNDLLSILVTLIRIVIQTLGLLLFRTLSPEGPELRVSLWPQQF